LPHYTSKTANISEKGEINQQYIDTSAMICGVISTYFLYLISLANVHFVGQGNGRLHLGGQTVKDSKKNLKKESSSSWTFLNVCEHNVEE